MPRSRKNRDPRIPSPEEGSTPEEEVPIPGSPTSLKNAHTAESAFLDNGEVRAIEAVTGEPVGTEEVVEDVDTESFGLVEPEVVSGELLEIVVATHKAEDLPLSEEERQDLIHLEQQVNQGIGELFRVGLALRQIRDRRLYRETHHNFKDYCQERFYFGSSYSFALVNAAASFENIQKSPRGADFLILPQNPYQLRPLEKLKNDPEKQAEAWARSVEKAQGKQPTFDVVSSVVAEYVLSEAQKSSIASPKYAHSSRLPNLLEGCIVTDTNSRSLAGRSGMWGIVCALTPRGKLSVEFFDKVVTDVRHEDVKKLRPTLDDAMLHERLNRLKAIFRAYQGKEDLALHILSYFGRVFRAQYTDFEEAQLQWLESRADVGSPDFDRDNGIKPE